MSLAARICSSVAGEKKPPMRGSRVIVPGLERISSIIWLLFWAMVSGFGLWPRIDGGNQNLPQVVLNPIAGKGLEEDVLLKLAEGGEADVGEIVLLEFFRLGQFGGGFDAGVDQGQGDQEDAGEADHAGHHAQVELAASEQILLREFFTEHLFEPQVEQMDAQGNEKVGDDTDRTGLNWAYWRTTELKGK